MKIVFILNPLSEGVKLLAGWINILIQRRQLCCKSIVSLQRLEAQFE